MELVPTVISAGWAAGINAYGTVAVLGLLGRAGVGEVPDPLTGTPVIATALGLFAAIPAVYFYNHFTSKVKGYASEMDDFALEFLNISERNFT